MCSPSVGKALALRLEEGISELWYSTFPVLNQPNDLYVREYSFFELVMNVFCYGLAVVMLLLNATGQTVPW